jgi:phosphoserine aminotransferase
MKYNFSAGPAILPKEVILQAQNSLINYENTGLSILEISHRSPEFLECIKEAQNLVREIYKLDERFEVLFLSGGASSQFFMVPMNFLNTIEMAGYVDTGVWASKAIDEAKFFGKIEVIASSKDKNYNYIPKGFNVDENLVYLHTTSNNTIYGTQMNEWPQTKVPIVCDMSSDIFSRPIEFEKFGLVYAGAQKNIGPAGVTLIIINKEFIRKVDRYIPSMLDLNLHIKNGSMYNTPPVFPIYVSMLTMRWIINQGGLENINKRNKEKAEIIYNAIDKSELFKGHSIQEDRSLMNVCFTLGDNTLEKEFLIMCEKEGIEGIKGHRSVGGLRASIYNAMPKESILVLTELMHEFERIKG